MKSHSTLVPAFVLGILLLTACGGSSNGEAEPRQEASASSSSNLTATITGAVEKELAVRARFSCQDNGISPDVYELVWGSVEQLHVSFPFSTEPGTYELIGSGAVGIGPGEASEVRYRAEATRQFDMGSGQLILESVPRAGGERAVGSLTASLSSDDGETVEISAEFDIETADYAFEGCG